MEYRGRKVRAYLNDDGGVFEGFIHSIDSQTGKLSLEKVINQDNGKKMLGLQHFFENEIRDIEVLDERATAKEDNEDVKYERSSRGVMKNKYVPPHLSRLKDLNPSSLTLKYQAEKKESGNVIDDTLAENEVRSNDKYTLLAHMDNVFTDAISFIRKHQVIGVALEGIGLGRSGSLCWLQIGTPTHVFLFDVLTLGASCFTEGLKDILEDESILKVFHDCRMASDILFHQYKINLVNVFDTQVADVFVYRLRHHNDWPRFVTALAPCLSQHLDLSPEQVHWAVIREHCSKEDKEVWAEHPAKKKGLCHVKEDEEVWAERPAKKKVVEAAVKDVIYLLELRQVLMEKMLEEFVAGVNIYLSHVRDASLGDSNKYLSMKHLLPVAFQDVRQFMESYRGRNAHNPVFNLEKDQHGFRENCVGIFQPDVNFSHNSLWHAGSVGFSKSGSTSGTSNLPKENKPALPEEQKPVNTELPVDKMSPNLGAKSSSEEPAHKDIADLSGSSLMRALIYSQEGNTHESESELDNFVMKPAGTLVNPCRRKKPKETAVTSETQRQIPERRKNEFVSKSDSDDSITGKGIQVKNRDMFMSHYNEFVRKKRQSDSGSSDGEAFPRRNTRSPTNTERVSEQPTRTVKESESLYKYVPRGVLSPKEVELFNNKRKSPTVADDMDLGAKGDNSDESQAKDKQSEMQSRNGLSLKSLITSQKQPQFQTLNGLSASASRNMSSAADDRRPVSERMQTLLDAIKKSTTP